MFQHTEGLNFPEMLCNTTDNGRFYTTPEGNVFPSVTTVLGKFGGNEWLEEWKNRVGEEQVKKVSLQATNRGTAVHEIIEKYLRNDVNYKQKQMPVNVSSFAKIKKFLDDNISEIGGLEVPLYSNLLRTAGRVDCIAKWNGVWSIVDFKTSKREKKKEDIQNYFLQTSAYSYMFFERTGIVVPKLVIVMTVDDGDSLVFEESSKNYIKKFLEMRNTLDV
jgi:predicted RecB family nuclease